MQFQTTKEKSQNTIRHVIEFDKLLLLWQAPVSKDPSRLRYIVGEIVRKIPGKSELQSKPENLEISSESEQITLHYLKDSTDFKKAQSLGFDGYAAFKIDKIDHTINVLDAFMRRLPPRSRTDFSEYLKNLRLPENLSSSLSDFALLGYSGAKLPSDGFSIIPCFESVPKPFEFLMEVAGFRHLDQQAEIKLNEIILGTPAQFEKEPQNPIDPHAIRILMQNQKIGYVPRGYLSAFHQWMEKAYTLKGVVERKNGEITVPSLYLFVAVS